VCDSRALAKKTKLPWEIGSQEKLAGWVARTRPLAEPLSPRGPQPVLSKLQIGYVWLNGPPGPAKAVPAS
jgi:hypothetical protein